MTKLDEQGEPQEFVSEEGRYAKGRILADVDAEDRQIHTFITLVTRMMDVYKVRSVMLNLMTDEEHEVHTPGAMAGDRELTADAPEEPDLSPTKPAPRAVPPAQRAGRRNDN